MAGMPATMKGIVATQGSAIADAMQKHPLIASALLGLVASLGFPPLHIWPATLLAIGAFAFIVRSAPTPKAAFFRGWVFGVFHFTLANNWIATAFTFQAEMPPVLGWLAVPLLALYLAVYPALAAMVARWLGSSMRREPFAAMVAGCWIVSEWLRGHVFTGYAWDPLGLIFLGGWDRPGIAAVLPWMGTYALSGLVVLAGGMLWALAAQRRWLPFAAVILVVVAGMLWPSGKGVEGQMPFTLVQPNLKQSEINDPTKYEAQFATLANLTAPRLRDGRRVVLWPESGVPDYLRPGYPQRYYDQTTAGGDPDFARRRIAQVMGPNGVLLTGAVDLEIGSGRAVAAYNTVTALGDDGEIVGSYSKAHLVPYGEYLALRWLLEPLGASRLVAGSLDFLPGPGPRTVDLGAWGEAGVQICYEIIFSGQTVDPGNRPDYIFNPSNDGWFGTWGPPQHLAQARMRAIEEGLPVLRATTTGISAVIDARGVVRQHIKQGVAARIDGTIPPAHSPTLFARLQNWLAFIWALLFIGSAVLARRKWPV